MALDVENVVSGSVGGEEFLRRARALEALHLALPPSGRLMRILGPIVLCALASRARTAPRRQPSRQGSGSPCRATRRGSPQAVHSYHVFAVGGAQHAFSASVRLCL